MEPRPGTGGPREALRPRLLTFAPVPQAGALEVCKAAVTTRFPHHEGVRRAAQGAMNNFARARSTRICDLGGGVQSGLMQSLQSSVSSLLGSEGGANNDWLDLLELAVTTDWKARHHPGAAMQISA